MEVNKESDNWKMSFDDGAVVDFDPALLCHNLQSLYFVIYPKAAQIEKRYDSLKTIIQGNGGIVLKEPNDYSITLLDLIFMDRHGLVVPEKKDWAYDLYSSRFIYESIRYGKVGDLNEYLLDSVYEDYNSNDILFNERGWSDLVMRCVEEGEVIDRNRKKNKKSITKRPSRSGGRPSEKENGTGGSLKSPNIIDQNEDKENGNDEEVESLGVDPPITSVEKVTKVRFDDTDLLLLPRPPCNINKSEETRSSRPLHTASTFKRKVQALLIPPNKDGEGQSTKTPTAIQTPTKTAPEIVPPKSPSPRLPTASTNNETEGAVVEHREPCSSRQARERDEGERNQTSVVPLTSASALTSPRGVVDSSPDYVVEISESEHEEERQGRPLPRSVSPIDDISSNDLNPPPAQREGNGQAEASRRRVFLPNLTRYSMEEDRKIVQQIIKHNWYFNFGGINIWVWMEQNRELNFGRTHQSLKERFRKNILPNLHKFNLTPDQLKSFQRAIASIKRGDRSKAIVPPLP